MNERKHNEPLCSHLSLQRAGRLPAPAGAGQTPPPGGVRAVFLVFLGGLDIQNDLIS